MKMLLMLGSEGTVWAEDDVTVGIASQRWERECWNGREMM